MMQFILYLCSIQMRLGQLPCSMSILLPKFIQSHIPPSMLFKLSYVRRRNVQDAEDVVQEAFYQYLKKAPQFESPEHEKAWRYSSRNLSKVIFLLQ